jgi:hypothetical protein
MIRIAILDDYQNVAVFISRRRMPWILSGLLLVAGSLLPSSAQQQTPASSATLFVGARLITDGDSPPIENSAFLVQNDRIVQIGTRNDVQAPAGAVRVDLSGKTVIPAIVNAHGHVGFLKDTSFDTANYSRENIINQLKQYAYYGTGAIMTAGTDLGDVSYEIRDNPVPGAALLRTAGRGFATPNAGPYGQAMRDAAYGVTTEEEGRKYVREIAAKKPDLIKICRTCTGRSSTRPGIQHPCDGARVLPGRRARPRRGRRRRVPALRS